MAWLWGAQNLNTSGSLLAGINRALSYEIVCTHKLCAVFVYMYDNSYKHIDEIRDCVCRI